MNDYKELIEMLRSMSRAIIHEDANERRITMNKYDMHKLICDQLNSLYRRKNEDYGDSFGKGFKEYGMTMAIIRLEDKLRRLKKLTQSGTQQIKTESVEDTIVDLANYAIMTLIELEVSRSDCE